MKEKIDVDFNPIECKAMESFLKGDPEDGSRIQEEFIHFVKAEMRSGKDHCPCTADCSIHGNCLICVQVHRGHGNHLPNCMRLMLNKKLTAVSELSEHTITDMVEKPSYLKK